MAKRNSTGSLDEFLVQFVRYTDDGRYEDVIVVRTPFLGAALKDADRFVDQYGGHHGNGAVVEAWLWDTLRVFTSLEEGIVDTSNVQIVHPVASGRYEFNEPSCSWRLAGPVQGLTFEFEAIDAAGASLAQDLAPVVSTWRRGDAALWGKRPCVVCGGDQRMALDTLSTKL